MRLCMFSPRGRDLERGWPGIVEGDTVVQVAAQTLQSFFTGGGAARRHAEYALADVDLRAPVLHPPSVRDFYAFEQHVKTARASRGQEVPPEWYEIPVFYFSNPAAIYGPGDAIPYPPDTQELDYELEVAAIIGAEGKIGGFTIMNDWSARDLQRAEMKVGLGPSKGKDFATSLGPIVVTPDEFDGTSATMVARVNGEERSRGELADMHHSWEAIVAHASRNTRLLPGDVLGSGTVGTGCILELDDGRWLQRGDVVELEVEGIGVLRNRIGGRRESGAGPRATTPYRSGPTARRWRVGSARAVVPLRRTRTCGRGRSRRRCAGRRSATACAGRAPAPTGSPRPPARIPLRGRASRRRPPSRSHRSRTSSARREAPPRSRRPRPRPACRPAPRWLRAARRRPAARLRFRPAP